jgi:hypothetical protein
MLKCLFAATAGLIGVVIATPLSAQPANHKGLDRLGVDLNLREPQIALPVAVAREVQRLLRNVGCPDWVGVNNGKWLASSSGQFAAFLKETGQDQTYEAMPQPTVADIRALFVGWTPKHNFQNTYQPRSKADLEYCKPSANTVIVKADLREDLTDKPGELPYAIAKEFQELLTDVGCPDKGLADGIWGPSSSGQFGRFLKKTKQEQEYETMEQPTAADIRKALFRHWTAKGGFMATPNLDTEYCEPRRHGGEDADKVMRLDVDLRVLQSPSKLPEAVAKDLQRALMLVGCPDWGNDDGKWLKSSSGQFATFLKKTEQVQAYEAMKQPSVFEIKKLFDGWTRKETFTRNPPPANRDPNYCEPVAGCNFSNEIQSILDSPGTEHKSANESKEIKELFNKVIELNKALSERYPVGSVAQGVIPPGRNADCQTLDSDVRAQCEEDGYWVKADLLRRFAEVELALRKLFRLAGTAQNPTCKACTFKVNQKIAADVSLPYINRDKLGEDMTEFWSEIAILQRSITDKQKLLDDRAKKRKVGSTGARDPELQPLKVLISDEQRYLEKKLTDVNGDYKDTYQARKSAAEIESATCLEGDSIYAMAARR